jgi:hypothetical protein
MRPGQIERRTRDDTRHGILTLFAALDAATGKVIGRCYPRHRGREFLSFLREIERNVPPELEVRLIMDNSATHKTPAIRKWLGSATEMACSLHPDRQLLGEAGRALLRRHHRKANPPRRLIAPPKSWKRRSDPTSRGSTTIQNPSTGPNPPTISSPP